MKRFTLGLALIYIFFPATIRAQNRYDALRYSIYEREGTARTISMGNAFTSLGGDLGAVGINPASLGLYRISEFTITPSLNIFNNNSIYRDIDSRSSQVKPGIANLGYLYSMKTGKSNGLINLNVGIVANVLKSYKTKYSVGGQSDANSWLSALAANTSSLDVHANRLTVRNNYSPYSELDNVPWRSILGWNGLLLDSLPDTGFEYIGATENIDDNSKKIYIAGMLDQNYSRVTSGSLNEFVLNVSGNISNNLFFGANLGVQSLYFNETKTYSEEAINPKLFQTGFNRFKHIYSLNTVGVGLNLQAGFIFLPIDGLRIGASISTPTWLNLNDRWEESIEAQFTNSKNNNRQLSPAGEYNYTTITPWRWNAGISYVFRGMGMVSIDYEGVSYGSISLGDKNSSLDLFRDENSRISSEFITTHNIRLGAEIKVSPSLALRAGYAFYQSPMRERSDTDLISKGEVPRVLNDRKTMAHNSSFISGGFGYSSTGRFFIDLGLQYRVKSNESRYMYDDLFNNDANPTYSADISNWKALLTVGFRF